MDAVISGIVHMDNIAAENSIIQPDNAKQDRGVQVDDEEAGIILEIPGDPLCPVKTLKFYLGRLNPACRALFQRPKEHIYEQDTCWYVNSPVGKNMLATMMSTISKCARLSRIYTNVRIRATTYSPADGKGCIPCTDVAEGPIREQEARDIKLPEKRPPEIAPKPVQVTQNSHIIKQLNAPIVQACLSVAVSNSLSSVTNAGSFINRVFPIALAGVPKNELMNGQAINIVNKPTEFFKMDAVISGIVHMDNIAAENSIIQPDNAKQDRGVQVWCEITSCEYCVLKARSADTGQYNLPPREIAAMLKGFM
ncbi:TRASH domain-containing protein [Trichonephila inaurata madagascariensis]|uniref:TRASH domain-containing protein n=1 Tax=Trichonephila inaurata madagascariensis TaxID=2747483 RepID=A0A8X6WM32_9ARAC|nr:TRASH domain-containing protein [Trichonephila inaurata madagascariensis]